MAFNHLRIYGTFLMNQSIQNKEFGTKVISHNQKLNKQLEQKQPPSLDLTHQFLLTKNQSSKINPE